MPRNKAARDRLREDRHAVVPMGEPSYQEVSDFIVRTTGKTCSSEYLGMLRRGERDNPTISLVLGLTEFFRVHRDELLGPSDVPAPANGPENGVLDRAAPLAERLERLYEQRSAFTTQPVTDADVAAAIEENEYLLFGIRTGKMPDVQISVLRKLALYFGVPVEYFVADDGEVSETVTLAAVLRKEGPIAFAQRALESSDSDSDVPQTVRSALATLLAAARGYDAQVVTAEPPEAPVNSRHSGDSLGPADDGPDEQSR
ncbi:hypothetical protein [Lentzea sp. NPDC092896]|uniref:hypothetical protein n=1 Tax=Lentzea sp. NPDC092896 TaxID=3364127 RepID=UPI003823AC04